MSSTLPPQSAATTTTTDDSWTSLATTITSTISWHIAETAKIMNTPTTLMQDDRIISTAIRDTTTTTTTSTSTTTPTHTVITSTTAVPVTSKSRLNVADLSASLQRFGIVDYLVFAIMLVVCALIGFYFGFIERKQKQKSTSNRRDSEALNYLVGGRKMKVVPVSISLVASFISGISLLGTSTEVYVYGTQYAFILVTTIFSGIISWYVFLPVFCNLQLTSTYEYFEMRFDRTIRNFASLLFVFGMILYLPVAIYVPALTFNQVTGVNIHIITPAVCLICTFYTCVGGLKAVIWTDVIQSFVMYGTILTICIKGTLDVGGLDVVLARNMEGGRLNAPAMTWDPTARLSLLSVLVGGTLHKIQSSDVNQISIQRFLSLPNLQKVKQTLILFTILLILLLGCCCYMGLLAYATYYDCDPLTTKLAKNDDQLPALLVMRILGDFPGLPGLFVAGVFSAALSTLSTGLNSLSCVIFQDLIKPFIHTPLTESQTGTLLRCIVVVFGFVCIGLVYIVEHMGMVLQLATMTSAVSMGPLLGIYTMGVAMPWINAKSVLTGSVTSFAILAWLCTNAQLLQMGGKKLHQKLPVSVLGCDYQYSITTNSTTTITSTDWSIYNLSFLWYTALGGVLCIVFAVVSSCYFGRNKIEDIEENLLSPLFRPYFKRRRELELVSFKKCEEISKVSENHKFLLKDTQ